MIQDFILWQKLEDFVEYFFPIVDKFPKSEKFALCSQIKNLLYIVMRDVIKMNKSRNKTVLLHDIDTNLELLRWFIRHSHKRKFLAHQGYETAAKKVDEIGRIVGGLMKGG